MGIEDLQIAGLVREMVSALVDDTDAVRIAPRMAGDTMVLDVTVAAGDVGKVVGKQGRTARSLRTILSGAAMKGRRRCELNIVNGPPRREVA